MLRRMTVCATYEDESDEAIADWIAGALRAPLIWGKRKPVAIAVPGGSTPFPIFEHLVKHDLEFEHLTVWPTDDRIVPEDHPASNTGRIRALFEPTGAKVMALREDCTPPKFELVWLGMGLDGHVASLFPNTDPKVDDPLLVRRITPDPLPPEAPFDRISLTLPALLDCRQMVFVIRGKDKLAVFEAEQEWSDRLPVGRLLTHANLYCRPNIFVFT
jgi:6-phosphogluconolactonase